MKFDLNLRFDTNEITANFKFNIHMEDGTERIYSFSMTFAKNETTPIHPEHISEFLSKIEGKSLWQISVITYCQ